MTISLNALEFYAYHGLYEGEKELGNRFIVDVSLECEVIPDGQLEHTVDYGHVYRIISKEMEAPKPLLEQLVEAIGTQLMAIERVQQLSLTIHKENPPIGGLCRSSSVSLTLP